MTTHTTNTNEQDRNPHEEGEKRARWNLRALIAKGAAALMAAGVLLATPRLLAAPEPVGGRRQQPDDGHDRPDRQRTRSGRNRDRRPDVRLR